MMKRIMAIFFIIICFTVYSEENNKMKIAYSKNGEIHYDFIGKEKAAPLTTGHSDMKPSITTTGDKIVFFRALDTTRPVQFWKTAICIINTDGTGFKQITSGKFTDYNPTWSRDGKDKIIFSRYDGAADKCYVYMSGIDSKPGEEVLISDPRNSEYAYSCLKDGRILVSSSRDTSSGVYFLLTPKKRGFARYDLVKFKFNLEGFMDRATFNQTETGIAYEYKKGWKSFVYTDKTIVVADFDLKKLTISNPKPISAESRPGVITIYPRWTKDGNYIIYHSDRSGRKQLYLYSIADKTTKKISLDENSDYEFPCGDDSPK